MGADDSAAVWQDLVIPGMVAISLLAYAREKQIPVMPLVEAAGLVAENASAFSAGLSLQKFQRLVQAMYIATGDDALGFELGWRMPPTTYGNVGQALMSSATVAEALQLCQRFWHLIARGILFDVSIHEHLGVVCVYPQFPMPGPLRRIVADSIVTSLYRGIVLMTPVVADHIVVWLDYPEPDDSARLRERMPSARFGMPMMQIRFPVVLLDTPLPMASAAGQMAAVHACEAEERALKSFGKVTARVQRELGFRASGYPTLAQVASHMGMAERTLRRHLADEGASYSAMLGAARLRDAILLLENPDLEIVQVATCLGYLDAANFTRAFKRWTDVTPSQFREARANASS